MLTWMNPRSLAKTNFFLQCYQQLSKTVSAWFFLLVVDQVLGVCYHSEVKADNLLVMPPRWKRAQLLAEPSRVGGRILRVRKPRTDEDTIPESLSHKIWQPLTEISQ